MSQRDIKHQFLYLHSQDISFSTLREALTILKAIYNQATPCVRSDWLTAGSSGSSLVTPFPLNLLHLYFVNFCAFIELRCKSCIDLKPAAIPSRQRTLLSLNRWGLHHQTGLLSNGRTEFTLTLEEVRTNTVREIFPVVEAPLLCSWLMIFNNSQLVLIHRGQNTAMRRLQDAHESFISSFYLWISTLSAPRPVIARIKTDICGFYQRKYNAGPDHSGGVCGGDEWRL